MTTTPIQVFLPPFWDHLAPNPPRRKRRVGGAAERRGFSGGLETHRDCKQRAKCAVEFSHRKVARRQS